MLRYRALFGLGVAWTFAAACSSNDSDTPSANPSAGRSGSAGSGGTSGKGGSGGTAGNSGGATGGGGGTTGDGGGATGGGAGTSGGSGGAAGGPMDAGADVDASGPKQVFRYVTNAIVLPTARADFALDLNGDARADNQLGNIVQALTSQGIDLQSEQDASVAAGTGLELLRLEASNAGLQEDPTASVTLFRATNTASPDFSGSGTFTVEGAARREFNGVLTSATFISNPPPVGVPPVKLDVRLALFGELPLIAARVRFTTSGSRLVEGKINGAVLQSDVTATLIPAFAQRMDAMIKGDTCSSLCTQIKQLFDADQNGTITVQEITTNAIIRNILAPDVDLLDATGNLNPNPANTEKDALSIAIGFSAVKANFAP